MSERAGVLAAFAWALHPVGAGGVRGPGWQGTIVFGLLLLAAVEALAALEERFGSGAGASVMGVMSAALIAGAWAGLGLWQEPLLLPFLGLWALARTWTLRHRGRAALAPAVVLAVAGLLAVPWVVRNARVVGTTSLRSWAGPEIWLGAMAGPGEEPPVNLHPSRNLKELMAMREQGEAAYARGKMDEAVKLVRERPGRWVAACAWRYAEFWWGRSAWWRASDKNPLIKGPLSALRGLAHVLLAAAAFAGIALAWRRVPFMRWIVLLFAVYPVTYALAHVEARYRLPLEPLMTLCACLGLLVLLSRRRLDEDPAAAHDVPSPPK